MSWLNTKPKDALVVATMFAQAMAWKYFPDHGELLSGLGAAIGYCVYRGGIASGMWDDQADSEQP